MSRPKASNTRTTKRAVVALALGVAAVGVGFVVAPAAAQTAPPPGDCPPGWRPVTPPLNPVLVCLPTIVVPPPGGPLPDPR